MKHVIAIFLCTALIGACALARDKPQAFVARRVITIAGEEIPDGVVVVQGGKILAVGPTATTQLPADAVRQECSGKVIMPGLVDTHSHIGSGAAGGDSSAPIQPDCRIYDSINVRDAGFKRARAGGITTLNIMPGSGHLLSGQTLYLKTRDGTTIDELALKFADGSPMGGMKMANGTNSIRQPPFPGTRAKSAALVREQFVKAQEYRDKIKRADGAADKLPARDLGLEAMLEVLDGKRIVHHHTHRHDDILSVLRLQKEFGFKVVLHHVSEGWKVAQQIADAKAPCSVIVIDAPGGKPEAQDLSLTTGKVLDEAGALVGFHTDDWITDSRLFLRSGALAVRAGMKRDAALKAMTINGAKMLELDSRLGSLEAGKDADFIILSGDPFSVYTHILETWVDGSRVFNRSDPKDYLFAVGGYGAGRDQVVHIDCFHDGDHDK